VVNHRKSQSPKRGPRKTGFILLCFLDALRGKSFIRSAPSPIVPWIALIILLSWSLTACQASPPPLSPTPTLLPPRLEKTPRVPITDTPTTIRIEEPPQAQVKTSTPFPQSLLEQARSVYGQRLIQWIRIPTLSLLAPVAPVGWSPAERPEGPTESEWDSPGAQVGWVVSSALPGDPQGNILLYGHNNIESSVFRDLWKLKDGDEVRLQTGEREYRFQVAEVHILPVLEREADAAYAEFLQPSRAPRLTLISCWPPSGNTHRVIVVAYWVTNP